MSPETLTEPKETIGQRQSEEECVHHWIIDPPDSPVSKGVCKICGAEKEFANYWGDALGQG